ncbi:MAG TPA: TIGR04283 family arsenosugar biosynthesis glycosyltransferase [Azospira sp.]|nr:TIGR04283 family arsenosugar biosynthesis glycosyltransferase [Azospira sp.]
MNTERCSETMTAAGERAPASRRPAVSIVVPVLDEGDGLVERLRELQAWRRQGAELVVVDGGSRDRSAELAAPLADRLVRAPRGRGRQMNAGAAIARGDLLLFLHADTRLPPTALAAIGAARAAGAQWGRFDVRIDGTLAGLALVALMMNWRSRLTGIATGDQAIFVTREAFDRVGGFPEIALMEDIAFCRRMRRESPPACLREKVVTSGRRWQQHGLLRTILLMWRLRWRFHFGADPDELARVYGYLPDER